jgi:hypothetical protein
LANLPPSGSPSDASEDVVGTTFCIDGGTTIYPGFAGNG